MKHGRYLVTCLFTLSPVLIYLSTDPAIISTDVIYFVSNYIKLYNVEVKMESKHVMW